MAGTFQNFLPPSAMMGDFSKSRIKQNYYAYGFGNCTFWLDAGEPNTLNTGTDLAAVNSWKDKIRGLAFVQATAGNQPRYIAADANFNSLPSIDFSVSTSRNLLHATSGMSVPQNFTIACVAKYGAINTNDNTIIGNSVAADAAEGISLGGGRAGSTGATVLIAGAVAITGTTEDTTTKIVVVTNTEIVVDGLQEATSTAFFFTKILNQIGMLRTTTTQQLRGQIAEIICFDNKLSSADCLQLSSNINKKYLIY